MLAAQGWRIFELPLRRMKRLFNFRYLVVALLLLQVLPYLILRGNSYIRLHDTLEGELIWYHLLNTTHNLLNFSSAAVVAPVMNGLTRLAFHSGLSLTALWIHVFGTQGGYIFNYILLHGLAFAGMYLLIKRHFWANPKQASTHENISTLLIAVCFAWVPFFTVFGATVAGQPWLLLAFLNLAKRRPQWYDAISILVLPFYSSIVWAAPAILGMGGLVGLYYTKKERRLPLLLFAALGLMTVLYLVANWQLLSLSRGVLPDFVVHRKEYDVQFDMPVNFLHSVGEGVMALFLAHYHVGTFVSAGIILASGLSLRYGQFPAHLPKRYVLRVLGGILGLCLFFAFYNYIAYFLGSKIPLIQEFKFNRVIILLPFLWLLLLYMALQSFESIAYGKILTNAFLACQLVLVIFANDEFMQNSREILGVPHKPNFNRYFAPELFEQAKTFIGKPQDSYRVACLGFNPSVAQYNGFYTLDGLQAVYDLNYKHQFRQIIADELALDKSIGDYFDKWGNRCYIFSHNLGREDKSFLHLYQQPLGAIDTLHFNTNAFAAMGGHYLFSAVKINNAADLHLNETHLEIAPERNATNELYIYQVQR